MRLPIWLRRLIPAALAVTLVAAGCRPVAAPEVVALIASYDLVAGRTGRFLLGITAADNQRVVAFGAISLGFRYTGPRGKPLPQPQPGPTAKADYNPIPGQRLDPGAAGPRLVDPSDAIGVYRASDVRFDQPGVWEVTATVPLGGTKATVDAAFEVLASSPIPNVGNPAPRTDNPIIGAAPAKTIDSRAADNPDIPDPELHNTSVAAAIAAHRPAVVVVSTPTYCQSRFCGPITDSVAALARNHTDTNIAFIHLEVWQDFKTNTINPAAAEWINPPGTTDVREPWVFIIGPDGRITDRFDNVAREDELQAAIDRIPR